MGLLVVDLPKALTTPPVISFSEPPRVVVGSDRGSFDVVAADALYRRLADVRQLCIHCYPDSPRVALRDGARLLRAVLLSW